MNIKKQIICAILAGLTTSLVQACTFVILNKSKNDTVYLTAESNLDRVEVAKDKTGSVHGMWFKIEAKDEAGEFKPLLLGKIHRCDMNADHNALTFEKGTVKYTNIPDALDTTRYEIHNLTKKNVAKKAKKVELKEHEPTTKQVIEQDMPAEPDYLVAPGGFNEVMP